MILAEELAWADAPRLTLFYVSLYHAAGTILAMGTPDQQRKYLPGILDGDVWCQGFSETEAGSDLAGLQTRAHRDGDSYVVSGHKIWSTGADLARYCLLLARTDVVSKANYDHARFTLEADQNKLQSLRQQAAV